MINEADLIKQTKQGVFYPVYLLYGNDRYMLRYFSKLLIKQALPKHVREMNLHKFTETSVFMDEIAEAALTAPFLSPKRLAIVENFPITKLHEKELEKLKKLIEDIPNGNSLVFIYYDLAASTKKSAKFKGLYSIIKTKGLIAEFAQKSARELYKMLAAKAAKSGCTLPQKTGYELIERCGSSLFTLTNELNKLVAYAQNREITMQDLDLLVTPNLESTSFALAKDILKRKQGQALNTLNILYENKIEEPMIVGALSLSFVDLYRAKAALNAQKDMSAITNYYSYKGKEFRIKNAMRDASHFSMKQIKQCLSVLTSLDTVLKTKQQDNRTLLETAIIKMIRIQQGGR